MEIQAREARAAMEANFSLASSLESMQPLAKCSRAVQSETARADEEAWA